MADDDVTWDAPAAGPKGGEDITWDAAPDDHGLAERQKLSTLGKAVSPITGYWPTYQQMNREAQQQIGQGLGQIAHPTESLTEPQAHGLSQVLTGAGNVAAGGLNYLYSPIGAGIRSIAGQPIEDVTGIPREYTEFGAQLAMPYIGLKGVPEAPGAASIKPRAAPADFVPPAREAPATVPRQTPRERAGIDLLPPETPHTLPPERRSLSAMGANGPLSDISPETINHMRKVMEDQGFNANTLDDRLGELSEHHMFGEITPSLEADMGAVSAPPGPGKQEVQNSLRQRAAEAPERVSSIFDRAFGPNENIAQLNRIMEIDRARAAAPLYRAFRNTVVEPTPEIDALMPRLRASGALQEANRSLEVEGLPATHGFMDQDLNVTRVPTPQAFQYAKEALDDQVEAAIRGGEKNRARRLVGLRNDLVSAIDNHPQVGDLWRQARSTYAQPTEINKALEFGRTALTNKVDPDELPFLTAAYSEPQMRAMRIGMRNNLERMLGKRDALTAETINTALSPNNVQKMRWAIGDQPTDQLVSAMEAERHMHTAPTRIYGGSQTQPRTEAQKRWSVQPGQGISMHDVAMVAKHPVIGGAKKAAQVAAEKVGLSMQRAKEAKMAKLREEASRIFTLQGPERDAAARFLLNGPAVQRVSIPPVRAQGGRVNNFHQARYGFIKKQGGGELSDDVDWSKMNQPLGELKAPTYTPTEQVSNATHDVLTGLGASPSVAGHLTEGLGGLANLTPLGVAGSAADTVAAQARGDPRGVIEGMAGMIPGVGGKARGAVRAGEEALSGAVREGLHPAAISTRLPTGAKATEDPIAQSLTVDTPAMKATPGPLYDNNVDLVRDYPGMKKGLMTGSTDRAAKQFQDQVTNNLLWLHDQVPPEIRDRSKLWYDGANRIVKDTAGQYGIPDQSAAGVYAALSPQKDWFQNVSLGNRLIDTYFNKAATPWSPQMTATAKNIWADPKYAPMLADIKGKTLNDLAGDPDLKAMWIRTYDQAHNSPAHQIVTPEGGFGDVVRTKSGAPSRIAWGSLAEIGKGVGAIESGGDPAVLSRLMGEKHKVRSFYNNMLDPASQRGDVTIDTHAVAAGLLRPLSGNSLEVAHNFANYPGKGLPAASGSAISGIQGTYPLYADAYRQAAAQRGILPREMQSITWEAVRGLFPDTFKTAKNNEAIDNIWKQYGRGRLPLDQARSKINDLAGGIRNPDWYGR
jgi:hypothetical protein